MKKYIAFLFLFVIYTLISCSKDDNNINEQSPEIIVGDDSNSQIEIAAGDTKTISFTANVDWNISIKENNPIPKSVAELESGWVSVSPMSGKAGNVDLKISLKNDTVFFDRSALITINAGEVKKELTVVQRGAEFKLGLVDISTETDADFMYVGSDLSYLAFSFNNILGCPIAHLGESLYDDFDNGYDIVFDEEGYPTEIIGKDICIYLANYRGDEFDALVVKKNEVPKKYLGLKANINFDTLHKDLSDSFKLKSSTKAIINRETQLFIATFGGCVLSGVTYGLALPSVGIPLTLVKVGVDVALNYLDLTYFGNIGKLCLAIKQANPSDIINNLSSLGLYAWAYKIRNEIDEELREQIDPIFDVMYTDNMKFNYPASERSVAIKFREGVEYTTKFKDSCGFGKITAEGSNVVKISVDENITNSERSCELIFSYTYTDPRKKDGKITKEKSINVTQYGFIMEINPEKLTFRPEGETLQATVRTNTVLTNNNLDTSHSSCQVRINSQDTIDSYITEYVLDITMSQNMSNIQNNQAVRILYILGYERYFKVIQVTQGYDDLNLPKVRMTSLSTVSGNTAISMGGEVTDEGGDPVYERGFAIGEEPNSAKDVLSVGSGKGFFYYYDYPVESNKKYYVTAYASNSSGRAYSEPKEIIIPEVNLKEYLYTTYWKITGPPYADFKKWCHAKLVNYNGDNIVYIRDDFSWETGYNNSWNLEGNKISFDYSYMYSIKDDNIKYVSIQFTGTVSSLTTMSGTWKAYVTYLDGTTGQESGSFAANKINKPY